MWERNASLTNKMWVSFSCKWKNFHHLPPLNKNLYIKKKKYQTRSKGFPSSLCVTSRCTRSAFEDNSLMRLHISVGSLKPNSLVKLEKCQYQKLHLCKGLIIMQSIPAPPLLYITFGPQPYSTLRTYR